MLETVANILDLFLDQFLLLFLNVKLPFTVVCKGQVIHVLDKLLSYVLETLKPTSQEEESLDVFLSSCRHCSFQGCDLFVNTACLIGNWQEDEQDYLRLACAWALILVLFDLSENLGLIDLPVIEPLAVSFMALPIKDHDCHSWLKLDCGHEE